MQGDNPTLSDAAALTLNLSASPIASSSHSLGDPRNEIICEGWLLKKRRKKLQGYARRYFVLQSEGILLYSFDPNSKVRDQISLPGAAISSSPGRKDIHVDSGRVTFHIKCLTKEDFDRWMSSMRKFTTTGSEMEKVKLKRSHSHSRAATSIGIHAGKLQHATIVLDEMSMTIDDLSNACLRPEEDDKRSFKSMDRNRPTGSRHKDKDKDDGKSHSLLSIFKKPHSTTPGGSHHRSNHNSESFSQSSIVTSENLAPLIVKLREQHNTLSDLLQSMSPIHSHYRSPLQQTINEEGGLIPTIRAPGSMHSLNRTSMSTVSDSWYDASEGEELGAEEYTVQDDPEDEETVIKESAFVDTDSSAREVTSDVEETPNDTLSLPVDRRTRLPSRPPADEGSLISILRKNVGQDLSNIAFPVTFNEPLTLLQRSAEELEYYELLDKAASSSDWIERICYVAAFAVSGYACTKHRSGRKGFTPLLGETFEDVRMNFIAEKVVHKPLVIAYHAEGRGWELTATQAGKTKFWGKSFEIIPTGINKVQIGSEVFQWNKPSSFTRNLVMGTKYLEHCGEMVIRNTGDGTKCVLDFKETGYWASSPNVVAGTIFSRDDKPVGCLEGKWDEQITQKLDSNTFKVLWRAAPFPRDASEYYGYTYFGITLNEKTPDIKDKLPSTDSRFRPDVRALEEGDVERAEQEKQRVEQMQRERRQNGQEPRPKWFKQVNGSDEWIYIGGYWEARRDGWKNTSIQTLW